MEAAYDLETTHAAACLGLWDALRAGVTTVANDEYFPEAVATAAERLGNRCLVANRINEFANDDPPQYDAATRSYDLTYVREKAEQGLAENVDFIERWQGHELVTPCLGPHAPDLLSTEMLQACAREADRLDVKMLIHVAQSQAEVAHVKKKGDYNGSIHYLKEIGFLSPRVQAAHMVWVDDDEIKLAAASGMGMSWTPTIMMACQSYAPVQKLIPSGIKMAFGTDCFSMDVLEELRYALYSANYVHSASNLQLKALDILRMATVGGAECLGIADEVGTLEPGKRADMAVLDFRDAQLVHNTNYFESIAYRAKSRDVKYTIVNGVVVCEDGHLTLTDEDELFADAQRLARVWVERSRGVLKQTGVASRIQPHFFSEVPA
jgi:5-methylthioadenosine/S-adenosylhomocysteine deaminase